VRPHPLAPFTQHGRSSTAAVGSDASARSISSSCWGNEALAGEWDNESDENVIESVTLTYDFFALLQ